MNCPAAGWADADQITDRRGSRDKIGDVTVRTFWRSTSHAIDFAGPQRLLGGLAGRKERAKVSSMNEIRPSLLDKREAARDPPTHRVLMYAEKLGDLRHRISSMDFDAADIIPPRHRSPRPVDKSSNIADTPP
jgi:hypothetical protein